MQEINENAVKINLKGHTLYRGVPAAQLTFVVNVPQWYSHDCEHDYITELNRRTVEIRGDIWVVNLKHPLVQNLLNVAIDKLNNDELMEIVKNIDNSSSKEYKIAYLDGTDTPKVSPQEIKTALKSVYGGVSMYEQIQGMSDEKIKERIMKIEKLPSFLKQFISMSSYRYSYYKYDRLLVVLIKNVFARQYEFFKGIKGWYHPEWQTPWHDKYQNKTHIFKTEVVIYIEEGVEVEETGTPSSTCPNAGSPSTGTGTAGGAKKNLLCRPASSKKSNV